MNEQDKAAFEAWLEANNFGPSWVMAENAWDAALAHRDSQPMVRLTDEEINQVMKAEYCTSVAGAGVLPFAFAKAIQNAMIAKNGGK